MASARQPLENGWDDVVRYRVLVPASFFAASVYLWFVASAFRGGVGRYELIGPSFFPKILLIAIIVLTAVEVLRALAAARRGTATRAPKLGDGETKAAFFPLDLALAVAITVGYVAALHWIGFILSTLAFQSLLLAAVFRQRRWRVVIGVPVVLTTVFFIVFIELMSVPLPRGYGIFHQLNKLIY